MKMLVLYLMTYKVLYYRFLKKIGKSFMYNGGCVCQTVTHTRHGIALVYGLDDRRSRVRFPAGAGNFSLHHRVQNVSGAHLASYPMGARGSFPGGKAAGA
jgi:hypothetical protein